MGFSTKFKYIIPSDVFQNQGFHSFVQQIFIEHDSVSS